MNITAAKKTSPGKENRVYRARPLGGRDWVILTLYIVLFIAAPLGYGYYRYNFGYTHFGPALADKWFQPWRLLAIGTSLILPILILVRILPTRRRIVLHRHGLSLHQPFETPRFLNWEDISGIAFATIRETLVGWHLHDHLQATLYPIDARPVSLNPFCRPVDLAELVSRIKARLYPRWQSRLSARLQAGEWLWFGRLGIHQQSLQLRPAGLDAWLKSRPTIYLWEQVQNITIQDGKLQIELLNHLRRSIPVAEVPNIELLWQLLRELSAATSPPPGPAAPLPH